MAIKASVQRAARAKQQKQMAEQVSNLDQDRPAGSCAAFSTPPAESREPHEIIQQDSDTSAQPRRLSYSGQTNA